MTPYEEPLDQNWIVRIFDESTKVRLGVDHLLSRKAVWVLGALLTHAGLRSSTDDLLTIQNALDGVQIFALSKLLRASAMQVTGKKLYGPRFELRKSSIRVTSPNAVGNAFLAPRVGVVGQLMRTLVSVASKYSLSERRHTCFAMALWFVLISIHPFSDGNGRVARHLFMRSLLEEGCGGMEILALPLMFQFQGARFDSAALLARTGAHSELLGLYGDSLRLAKENFTQDLMLLERSVEIADATKIAERLGSVRHALGALLGFGGNAAW